VQYVAHIVKTLAWNSDSKAPLVVAMRTPILSESYMKPIVSKNHRYSIAMLKCNLDLFVSNTQQYNAYFAKDVSNVLDIVIYTSDTIVALIQASVNQTWT
jgi:hypothetical protein